MRTSISLSIIILALAAWPAAAQLGGGDHGTSNPDSGGIPFRRDGPFPSLGYLVAWITHPTQLRY
jgi:hypothetical protein